MQFMRIRRGMVRCSPLRAGSKIEAAMVERVAAVIDA